MRRQMSFYAKLSVGTSIYIESKNIYKKWIPLRLASNRPVSMLYGRLYLIDGRRALQGLVEALEWTLGIAGVWVVHILTLSALRWWKGNPSGCVMGDGARYQTLRKIDTHLHSTNTYDL